jgi:hypothetical protein
MTKISQDEKVFRLLSESKRKAHGTVICRTYRYTILQKTEKNLTDP